METLKSSPELMEISEGVRVLLGTLFYNANTHTVAELTGMW